MFLSLSTLDRLEKDVEDGGYGHGRQRFDLVQLGGEFG